MVGPRPSGLVANSSEPAIRGIIFDFLISPTVPAHSTTGSVSGFLLWNLTHHFADHLNSGTSLPISNRFEYLREFDKKVVIWLESDCVAEILNALPILSYLFSQLYHPLHSQTISPPLRPPPIEWCPSRRLKTASKRSPPQKWKTSCSNPCRFNIQ